MSTPHSNSSPSSEVFDAHLDAIGALAWKPFETAKRLPQSRTDQRLGSGYPNKRRPIGSRQRQDICAEPPVGPDYPPQEAHGTGSGFLIQGAGQQAFAGEIQRRGVEHRPVLQSARGRPPRQQPAQPSDLYHREPHQRPFMENVRTIEPGTAGRQQQQPEWVPARNDRYRQEQDHYYPRARPGQGHGQFNIGWVHGIPRDVYPQGQTNYPRPHPQYHSVQTLNAEGPWLPNADPRGGTHYSRDRQHRRRVGYQGRGEY